MTTTTASLVASASALGVLITSEQAGRMLVYLDRILDINRELNLTAVRDREQAVVRHVLDSLTVIEAWTSITKCEAPAQFLDVGTGGGFPGAILAAAWPWSRGLLIDQTGKKLKAVADAAMVAGIENVRTLHVRGSQMRKLHRDTRGAYELAVARAVGPIAEILRECQSSIAPGGYVFAMKGPEPPADEIAAASAEAAKLGYAELPVRTTNVPGLEKRTIFVYRRPVR